MGSQCSDLVSGREKKTFKVQRKERKMASKKCNRSKGNQKKKCGKRKSGERRDPENPQKSIDQNVAEAKTLLSHLEKKELDLHDEPCEQRKLETIEEMNQKLTEQNEEMSRLETETEEVDKQTEILEKERDILKKENEILKKRKFEKE